MFFSGALPEQAWVTRGDEVGRGDVTLSSLLDSAMDTTKSVCVCVCVMWGSVAGQVWESYRFDPLGHC